MIQLAPPKIIKHNRLLTMEVQFYSSGELKWETENHAKITTPRRRQHQTGNEENNHPTCHR
jgi:hypothetical protein